jgi:hypothetical protein
VAYLTSAEPVQHALLAAFEVLDVMPFDRKQLRAAIRSRHIGNLEIKIRGTKLDPETLRQELRPSGDQPATLLIAGGDCGTSAILAHRVRS